MYIGRAQESRQAIIFLDLGTGRIKQKVILPYDRETSVSARNPIEYFPAYVDGFVVVGGGSLVIHGDPLASTTERNFQPGPLLVMAFPW